MKEEYRPKDIDMFSLLPLEHVTQTSLKDILNYGIFYPHQIPSVQETLRSYWDIDKQYISASLLQDYMYPIRDYYNKKNHDSINQQ